MFESVHPGLSVLTLRSLAWIPAVHRDLRRGRLWTSFSLSDSFNLGHNEPSKLPCGEKVNYGIQNAVEAHEEQGDLMSVVERLNSVQVPGHVAPALFDLQHCQYPWALDDMVGQEAQSEHPNHCQQHLESPAFDPFGPFWLSGRDCGRSDFWPGRILRKQRMSNKEIAHHHKKKDNKKHSNYCEMCGSHYSLMDISIILVALEAASDVVLVSVGPWRCQRRNSHQYGQHPDDDAHNDPTTLVVRRGRFQRSGDRPVPVDTDGSEEEDGTVGVDEE